RPGPDGTIRTTNKAFTTILGTHPDDLQSAPFTRTVIDDDRVQVAACTENLSSIDGSVSFVCRMACHDRTERWYMWTIYAQQPDVFHGVGKDITPYKEMESKEDERNIFAEALLDTVLAINSSLSLEQVLERILSNVGKVVAYDFVNLMLVNGESAEIAGIQFRGSHDEDMRHLHHRAFSIRNSDYLRTLYDTQDSLIVPRVDHPPVWMTSPLLATSGSFLGTPIVVEDEVIGFLGVFNTISEYFTQLHAQQLLTFANQAGSAIKNARLYEQAQTVAVLKERQRMAQELHDSVNQNLFAASTYADLLPRALTRKPEVVERYAADINRLVRGAVAQMRMILIELHPDALTSTELKALLKQQCDAFSSHTGITVNFHADQHTTLERDDQIAIYRIVQEALHNIDRHASASLVMVRLTVTQQLLALEITDNGTGFDLHTIGKVQFGVRGMRERATAIGAQFEIQSAPGAGTQIRLRKKYYAES
ncbi:MAG: histidine kinase, partial [Chloroflexota bacterium]